MSGIFSKVQWETIEEFKSEEQKAHLRKKVPCTPYRNRDTDKDLFTNAKQE